MDDRQLIADLLSALEYHTKQTRPIEFSKVAIQAAREYLQKPAQPDQGQSCYCLNCEELSKQVTALKLCVEVERGFNAQEQPAQGCDYCNHPLYVGIKCKNCGREQPAQQQSCYCLNCEELSKQVTALKLCVEVERGFKAQEQPAEQEPVVWGNRAKDVQEMCEKIEKYGAVISNVPAGPYLVWMLKSLNALIYTPTPPAQRTWVGLTDEEIIKTTENIAGRKNIAKAIEAKLREKNT